MNENIHRHNARCLEDHLHRVRDAQDRLTASLEWLKLYSLQEGDGGGVYHAYVKGERAWSALSYFIGELEHARNECLKRAKLTPSEQEPSP